MVHRCLVTVLIFCFSLPMVLAEPSPAWWGADVEKALAKANDNRGELAKALSGVPKDQRKGMEFLIANMPDADLIGLKAAFLLTNHELAYKALRAVPWGQAIPEDVFFNDVLPYANVDEKRDPWRQEFYDLCLPMVKGCKTPSEAVQKLNTELFKHFKLGYAPQRKAPNLSPKESIAQGNASCTGLSIVLSDACRAVCIPARLVGTPNWADKRGNHTWIEVWDKDWHFTGACEPDPKGLDKGWFVADAAQAKKESLEHAIYAASFRKTDQHFPLVWARNSKTVSSENVTDRYTKNVVKKTDTFKLNIRVLNGSKKRITLPVAVTMSDERKTKHEGQSRNESADTNDFLSFDLRPNHEYVVKVGEVQQKHKTGPAGEQRLIDVVVTTSPDSANAVKALRDAIAAKPKSVAELIEKSFVKVPLTKADAAVARTLLWDFHVALVQQERAQELKDRVLKEGTLEMPFEFKTFGEKPKGGRSLWISLHGGGNAPKAVNDKQWQNQKSLYTLSEGIYLAPRAPTNTWNLWHEAHIDRLFTRLIEDLIVLENVNPDRVYVMGYSAGGDGVYQLAPRMADAWAGAAMMAGHPNGVSLLSLRNVPFALQVGGNDAAYNRNKVGQEYGEQLTALQQDDPTGYPHFVKIHEGKGHWMDREDKAALPWLAKHTRNPIPDRVVWKQTGTVHDRSYWLAVPPNTAQPDALIVAKRDGQNFDITTVEKAKTVLVRLDDRMADLDQPITITHAGKELFRGTPSRTIGVLLNTLAGRGDPKLMFDSEIRVEFQANRRR